MTEPLEDVLFPKWSPEQIFSEFRQLLDEMEETPSELAKRMQRLGDHRSFSAILRSIQRMAAGETGVSGEMLVIAKILVRQQRYLRAKHAGLRWETLPNRLVSAQTNDQFQITLYPESRGRWRVEVKDLLTGNIQPWPVWQEGLEAAKRKALTVLGDAEFDRSY